MSEYQKDDKYLLICASRHGLDSYITYIKDDEELLDYMDDESICGDDVLIEILKHNKFVNKVVLEIKP